MKKRIFSLVMVLTFIMSAALAGCAPSKDTSSKDASSNSGAAPTDTSDPQNTSTPDLASAEDTTPVTIKTTFYPNEVSPEIIADFQKQYPYINIEVVSADNAKLMAMLAAGNGVDLIRTQGISMVPSYVARGLALPLDSYLENSTVLKKDDFAAVQALYQFDGNVQGQGPVYGFVKDWSVDTTLWINAKIFKDAGVPIPSTDTPLTYAQIADMARQISQKSNGKIFGFVPNLNTSTIAINLASLGKSLWSDDLKTSNFSSPEAKEILQYYVDLQKEGVIPSSAHPVEDGWGGVDFQSDKIGIIQQGYWYGGYLKSNEALKDRLSDFIMLPSPSWEGGKPIPAVTGGTGAIVYAKTEHPDAVWKFCEYFFGGKPAEERAKGGWGLPNLKSMMNLLPSETDFEKSINAVNDLEVQEADLSLIKVNKWAGEAATDPILTKYLDPVTYGKSTLDEATASMDKDISNVILDNMDIAGE